MNKNLFFKPSKKYKEFMILDIIDKNSKITQREISDILNLSVSSVNYFIDSFEKKGFIKRIHYSYKNVEYLITQKGINRKRLLNIEYLKDSQVLYNRAKENIDKFLYKMTNRGVLNIYLYGAGEVAEIFLDTIFSKRKNKLNILGVFDDDKTKIGSVIKNIPIIELSEKKRIRCDGILISSYTNKDIIKNKLLENNYKKEMIYNFFDFEKGRE